MKTKVIGIIICIMYIFCNIYATDIKIDGKAAIVMETSSKRILFEKNISDKRKIASTTKLMTAMVVLDNCNLEDKVVVSKSAAYIGGSTIGIKLGDEITVEALLYGLLLKSGNDCAVALAEHTAGSIENFATLMNNKALKLGAKNTNYTNPHGLDTDTNYSTAYDLALIAKETLNYPELQKIMGTKTINIEFGKQNKYLANTNRLLHTYEYCTAGKTGFTNGAEMCLVTIAKKGELEIIAVVLGASTSDNRFNDGKKLMEYAFNTYEMVDISEELQWYISIPVYKGNILKYEKHITDNLCLPLKEEELENIYVKQTLLPVINAPMNKGTILGDIGLYIGNECIYLTEVRLDKNITKNTVWDYVTYGIKHIFDVKLELF